MRFHIYHIIVRCTDIGKILLNDRKMFLMCKQESSSEKSTKINTRKEPVVMEKKYMIFVPVFIYQPYKGWNLLYHMYVYLVRITVLQCDAQPSNVCKLF